MDYTSLLSTVEARLNRSDLSTLMDGFIAQVESEANAFLARNPVRPMVTRDTATTTVQENDLPSDFLDMIELTANDGVTSWPLARVMPGKQFDYYDNKALPPGITYDATKPQQYRILGTMLILSMTPASSLDLTFDYYAKLQPVTSDNATNWLMDAHPDVYEFGVLGHAGRHLRDYDFYERNRELFLGALDMVAKAYPEKGRDVGLRDTGAPWASGSLCGAYYG